MHQHGGQELALQVRVLLVLVNAEVRHEDLLQFAFEHQHQPVRVPGPLHVGKPLSRGTHQAVSSPEPGRPGRLRDSGDSRLLLGQLLLLVLCSSCLLLQRCLLLLRCAGLHLPQQLLVSASKSRHLLLALLLVLLRLLERRQLRLILLRLLAVAVVGERLPECLLHEVVECVLERLHTLPHQVAPEILLEAHRNCAIRSLRLLHISQLQCLSQ
mmetsp:Transcript_7891/g.33209  ORF Transcript_7891/g.33209 Transcript_7891/m.33209 type:complete len:213 (-) Transcript_7891:42-680(-)